ncbi:MAG: hypothetical protein ACERKN_05620 [Velocimicrobium sp.]
MEHKDESYLDSLLEHVSSSSDSSDSLNTMLNNDANSFQINEKDLEEINMSDIDEDALFDLEDDFSFDELDNIDEFEDFDDVSMRMEQEFNSIKLGVTDQMLKNDADSSVIMPVDTQKEEIDPMIETDVESSLLELKDTVEEPQEQVEESQDLVEESKDLIKENLFEEKEPIVKEEQSSSQDLSEEETTENIEPFNQQEDANEEKSLFEDNLMESLLSDESSTNEETLDEQDKSEEEIEEDNQNDPMADVEDLLGLLESEASNPDALDNLDMFAEDNSSENEQEDIFSMPLLDEEFQNTESQEGLEIEENLLKDSVEEVLESKPRKIGFFKRLFGNIHDEKARKQNESKEPLDEDGNPIIKPQKTKDQIKAEKALIKKEQDEIKKEKASKAAEIKAQKLAEKKEKAQSKKEKKIKVVVEEEEGRINRMGATIVFMLFGIIAACIILGTDSFSYAQSIKNATKYFGIQKYNNAYDEVSGIEIKEKDHEMYDKIMTVMFVNKQLNSYNNYYNMEMYPEALDSLLKGLQRYDEYISIAKELGIKSDLDFVRTQILAELNSIFELTEMDSYSIIHSDSQEKYSQKVIKAASIN